MMGTMIPTKNMERPIARPIWNSLPPNNSLMSFGKKNVTNNAEKAVFAKSYKAHEMTLALPIVSTVVDSDPQDMHSRTYTASYWCTTDQAKSPSGPNLSCNGQKDKYSPPYRYHWCHRPHQDAPQAF